jgi:Domain of unknown function (DUF4412)
MIFLKNMSWLFLLATMSLSQSALAAGNMIYEKMDPKVSYSGKRMVKSNQGRVEMREYQAPGKKRIEMSNQGRNIVMIIRMDKSESWMLIPEAKAYMKSSMADVNQNTGSGFKVLEQTVVGKEQVNGYATTKYKGTFLDPQARKGGGYFWLTKDHGIPIKTDITLQTAEGKEHIFTQLTELKIGPQPQSLFELPDSYRAMPVGMAGMFGNPSGAPSMADTNQQYMQQMQQIRTQREKEEKLHLAKKEREKASLSHLTLNYLKKDCWFDREAQIKVNDDGSYDIGLHAGSGYAMQRSGDSIEEFRRQYDGLVSKSENRFVVRGNSREWAYERRRCVTVGNHSIAGSGTLAQDSSERNAVEKTADAISNTADKIKAGFGSFFK